jgi:hypothetical protein
MTEDPFSKFKKVLLSLESFGFMLASDRAFPNVASLIAGKPVKGSWWSHPLAHTIFAVNEMLEDHKDVLLTKLISGKVTFVHRNMWQQVYSIAIACDDWQTEALSSAARELLKKLQNQSTLDTTELVPLRGKKPGDIARELELRLLIHAEQFHTESGAHAKMIETWKHWADRVGLKGRPTDPQSAKQIVERRVNELNHKFGANGRLPWSARSLALKNR